MCTTHIAFLLSNIDSLLTIFQLFFGVADLSWTAETLELFKMQVNVYWSVGDTK